MACPKEGHAWCVTQRDGASVVRFTIPVQLTSLEHQGLSSKEAHGIDPKEVRRQEQERARVAQLNTLERTARAWHDSARGIE
jgi:hypothetical protein